MVEVPGLVPTAAPSIGGGTPEINMAVPVDAFGGAVGHALKSLGADISGAADKVWQQAINMQNLQNETEAKSADADYMMKAGMKHAEFNAREGANASPEALQAHIKELQDLRVQTRAGLSNPMAQKMFDGSSLSFMGRTIFNAAGHAAQQTKVAANNASSARVQATQDNIAAQPTDDITFQRGKRAIESEIEAQGRNSGWSQDQIAETSKKTISETLSKRIASLARTDVFGAQKLFDQGTKSGSVLPMDALKVQATIQTQYRQQGSRVIADQVLGSLREGEETSKTLDEYLAEGMSKIKEGNLDKDDPLFRDFVRERITADYNRHKSVVRDGEQNAEQTVAAAMMTGNKEGILPKSVEELRLIDPKVGEAWDHMKPTTQKKYMSIFAQNAKGERVAWTDDSLRTYQQIKGQAHDDPVAFLARDVVEEKLPTSAKRELINLQQRLRLQPESDPRVARAISVLTPDLRAAGIDRASDKDGYYQFVGALQDQLDQFQKDHKKVPGLEEVRTIGAQLMQEQATGRRGWLIFTDEKTPVYQMPVPDEEKERISRDPFWAQRNIKPNDGMIARIYRAQKFKELYGGSAKKDKGGGVSFPPNATE